MKALRTTEFDLQFALDLSAWWLLLLLPLAALAAWRLYRRQFKGVARSHAWALVALRVVLLAGLVFLAFRPSLIHRTVLRYPGRVLLVADDSESMTAKDPGLSDAEALAISRRLQPGAGDQSDAYHRLADVLREAETAIRAFEVFAGRSDVREDAFWDAAAETQDRVAEMLDRFAEAADAAPAPPTEERSRRKDAVESVAELGRSLPALFARESSRDRKAFDKCCGDLGRAAEDLLQVQAALDRQALAAGNEALRAAASAVRARSRLDLVSAILARSKDKLPGTVAGQNLEVVRLLSGKRSPLSEVPAAAMESAPGVTDLAGRLQELAGEESEFPLTAVVALTDGRDLGGVPLDELQRALSRKQVPVFAAGVGGRKEPTDLAILKIDAAPFAVKGSPMNVRVRVKASLPEPAAATIEILRAGRAVASKAVTLGAQPEETVAIGFAPAETGFFRHTVRLASVPGEVFPVQNNSADFAVHVREDKVRVLLLDWKPRWETRFALNIFSRLDYIDLNAIVVLAQKDAALQRGVKQGTWPESPDALAMYELVVLGDIPPGLLSEAEWNALRAFVEERGKALCVLGSAAGASLPKGAEGLDSLLPLQKRPGGSPAGALAGDLPPGNASPALLRLTDSGRVHPIARALAAEVAKADDAVTARLLPQTQVLLADRDAGEPAIAARFAGPGKVLTVETDQLWKVLNPRMLSAHGDAYVNLITWAVDGGFAAGDRAAGKPALALDWRAFKTGDACQVWLSDAAEGAAIEAVSDGEVLAKAAAGPVRKGSELLRAVFEHLPARDIHFRVQDRAERVSPIAIVLEDNPELLRLARDEDYLKALARGTGGEYREFTDLDRCFLGMVPKERIEKRENVWRLWDSGAVLAFLALVLTAEWVWRKLVGLV